MANDRIYVRCRRCLGGQMLGKYWGGGECWPITYSVPPHGEDTGRRPELGELLAAFFQKHLMDCHEVFGQTLGADFGAKFEICTEDDLA